jgi:hypothetical protein
MPFPPPVGDRESCEWLLKLLLLYAMVSATFLGPPYNICFIHITSFCFNITKLE